MSDGINGIAKVHYVRRTSSREEEFFGMCILCGEEGLKWRNNVTGCSNPNQITHVQAAKMLLFPETKAN